MFERFTNKARRTVVLAQEEARRLQHNYIGTEHVLLGLLGEPEGFAARALARFDLTSETVREDVLRIIGMGKNVPSGHIPFTPRAKKCLELSLREALALNHSYIGTEHILLGLIREGEGVAAQIMADHAGNLAVVRAAVLDMIPPASAVQGPRWLRRRAAAAGEPEKPEESGGLGLRTTPAADASLANAARLAGPDPVGSHHMLLAALADPDSAAARALASLGVDLDRAREVLEHADLTGSSDELPEEAGRRQMLIRVSDDRLTIEAADQAIVKLGRETMDALQAVGSAGAEKAAETDVIRGDQPGSASLGSVWLALRDALEDITRRAAVAAGASSAVEDAPAGDDEPETG